MVVLYAFAGLVGLIILFFAIKFIQFYIGKKKVHAEYSNRYKDKIKDLGSVKKLSITPIIDYFPVNDTFKTEAGVSYLIETASITIFA